MWRSKAARGRKEEARRTKGEEFLADLEGNLDPARAWNLIKSLSGSPHSTAISEPLIQNSHTFLTNTGKANAFVQQYAAVNRLSIDKIGRTQARHLKKAVQLPTAAESCGSPSTFRELDTAIHATILLKQLNSFCMDVSGSSSGMQAMEDS